MRHSFRLIASVSLVTIQLLSGTARAQLQLQTYVSGLTLPVDFVQDPSNPAIQYVVEQRGRIRTIVSGTLVTTPFLDLSPLVACCGDLGLLGLAFPPDYAASGRFYINYTDQGGNTVIARYLRSPGNPLVADASSRFALRWGSAAGPSVLVQSYPNHNGGHLAFGPDGYLYIGTGDGELDTSSQNNAQNPGSLRGKMLRIDVSVPLTNPNGYAVPSTNPFDQTPSFAPEIWAMGLRNPRKFSFDPPALGGRGSLIIGDDRQLQESIFYEEAQCSGHNYGWKASAASGGIYSPMVHYDLSIGSSVIGGVVYRGGSLQPSFWGRYFYGDRSGRVWSVGPVPFECGGITVEPPLDHTAQLGGSGATGPLTAIGTDADGEMYLVNYSGTILKLIDPIAARVRRSTDFYGLRDRHPDLLWFNESTRQLAAWHMSPDSFWNPAPLGNHAFIAGPLLSTPALPAGWQVVGSFSEGLHQTELFLESDSGQLGMWVFSDTVFQYGVLLTPAVVSDPLWRVRAVGDFNHDGHGDLVWQYAPTGQVAFWLLNGRNAIGYAIPAVAAPGPDWEIFGTGDSGRDGQLDLYWQHRPTGGLAVWRMAGTNFVSSGLVSASPTDAGWRATGVSDLDVDGSPDIVFQHVSTGDIAAWYLNGETFRVGTVLYPTNAGDPSWKLVGPQ